MNVENLLSYKQLMTVITSDINMAHCVAVGYAIDLYIIDHGEFEEIDKVKVIDILNVFTQTSEIIFKHDSYLFEEDDVVDVVEKKLLRLFKALRKNRFRAIGIFEDDNYIGFKDHFGVVLKARKVGE